MKYYVRSGGKIYGPADEGKIAEKVATGFFSSNCLISVDREEWVPMSPEEPQEPDEAVEVRLTPKEPEEVRRTDNPKTVSVNKPATVVVPNVIRLSAADIVSDGVVAPKKADGGWNVAVTIIACLFLLLLFAAAGWLLYSKFAAPGVSVLPPIPGGAAPRRPAPRASTSGKSAPGPATTSFKEVCKNYQSAVGVVVVTLEDSDGRLLTNIGNISVNCYQPVGTAFAIASGKFATNCHVAYAVKDAKNGVLKNILLRVYMAEARKHGVKSEEEFAEFCRKNQSAIAADRKYLQENVRVRSVEIRLSHSDGESLPVTGVQIHPRYKANGADFKNAEFDVAILTTSKNAPTYFRLAGTDVLYNLAQGQKIAYLGFPMEGLLDDGALNIEKPEATFKSGTVNKITDFNNVHGDPKNNRSLVHDIPTVGGASGSPIFLDNGEVVAVLWGGNHNFDENGRRTASAAQHNFAVRIDSLAAVEDEPVHNISEWLGEKK